MREPQPGNRFSARDLAEIAVGACLMAFSASFAATVVDSIR